MTKRGRGDARGNVTIGLVMIAAGIVLVLDHLGVVQNGGFGLWWPVLVMAIGLGKILSPLPERDAGEGVMLVLLGVWFLSAVHHWLGLTWRNSWPLIFVAMGAKTVFRALMPPSPKAAAQEEFHA
jgi:Na+-transporting methylmalonyl-CoA/oxaloacetate decarboxylase beta subunit